MCQRVFSSIWLDQCYKEVFLCVSVYVLSVQTSVMSVCLQLRFIMMSFYVSVFLASTVQTSFLISNLCANVSLIRTIQTSFIMIYFYKSMCVQLSILLMSFLMFQCAFSSSCLDQCFKRSFHFSVCRQLPVYSS